MDIDSLIQKKARVPLAWLGISCFIVIVIWWFYPGSIVEFLLGRDQEVSYQIKGLFGDQFGALSALFSGLAFAGIIYTILLQRSDLVSTREEVARQNNLSEKQAFENTLFQMLFSRQEILKDLNILGDNGRRALDNFFKKIIFSDGDFPVFISLKRLSRDAVRDIKAKKNIDGYESSILTESERSTIVESFEKREAALDAYLDSDCESQLEKLKVATDKAVYECIDEISHYLRYTFWIYKTIDSSEILTEAERVNYANIVRSQLSDTEVATIFYVVVVSGFRSDWSDEPVSLSEMNRLVLKYQVVDNLSERFLIHELHKKSLTMRANNAKA